MSNPPDKSEFNEAIGFLRRMDVLFQKSHADRMNMDMTSYCNALIGIYVELESDINEKDSKEIQKQLLTQRLSLGKRERTRQGVISVRPEKYEALFKIDISLRAAYDKSGYKTRRSEDPRTAMGR